MSCLTSEDCKPCLEAQAKEYQLCRRPALAAINAPLIVSEGQVITMLNQAIVCKSSWIAHVLAFVLGFRTAIMRRLNYAGTH